MELHCLYSHDDEASELENCGQSGDQDELILFEELAFEVLYLCNDGDQRNNGFHTDIDGVLVC